VPFYVGQIFGITEVRNLICMLFTAILISCSPSAPPVSNSIMVLKPYKYADIWVFDDESVGLKREAFVAGAPDVIEDMVKEIPGADNGFRMLFSATPFPGYTHSLTWQKGDKTGNWYLCDQTKKEAWLCPGLFKYFKEAPKTLYAKAEKLGKS
jgi:hypothetical protein